MTASASNIRPLLTSLALTVTALLFSGDWTSISAQSMTEMEALEVLYGDRGQAADSYNFSDVMTYDMVIRSTASDTATAGLLRVLYNPGDSAFAIDFSAAGLRSITLCDVAQHVVVMLSSVEELRLGQYMDFPSSPSDSAMFRRVSGDREIAGCLNNHFFLEEDPYIIELWSCNEANEDHVRMGRLWPQFMRSMQRMATGNHWGLPMRWTSTDTRNGTEPQIELELISIAPLKDAETVILADYIFQVSPRDEMIQRMERERTQGKAGE